MKNVRVHTAGKELHIASFIVQHRPQASAALADHLASAMQMELARGSATRSVVLCEGEDQYVILDRIDELRAIPGVLNVTLVYHHAEPREALDALMPNTEAGAAP